MLQRATPRDQMAGKTRVLSVLIWKKSSEENHANRKDDQHPPSQIRENEPAPPSPSGHDPMLRRDAICGADTRSRVGRAHWYGVRCLSILPDSMGVVLHLSPYYRHWTSGPRSHRIRPVKIHSREYPRGASDRVLILLHGRAAFCSRLERQWVES